MCRNNGIGINGQLPWQLPEDMAYFAKVTKGKGLNAVIMGEKTWQSLPIVKDRVRGLVNRDNFVLSQHLHFDQLINHERLMKTFKTLADLEQYIQDHNTYAEVWVIGGANVYKQFLNKHLIKKCFITRIDKEFECDTFFPVLDTVHWKESERIDRYDQKYDCQVNYLVYDFIGYS